MHRQTRQITPKKLVSDLIFQEECYAILGACFEVYKNKGSGFHEPVYQECLGIEFEYCRIPAIPEPGLSLEYRGKILTQQYFPDFVCFGKVIVALKSVTAIVDEHRAQVLIPNLSTNGSSKQFASSTVMKSFIFDKSAPRRRHAIVSILAFFGVFSG